MARIRTGNVRRKAKVLRRSRRRQAADRVLRDLLMSTGKITFAHYRRLGGQDRTLAEYRARERAQIERFLGKVEQYFRIEAD